MKKQPRPNRNNNKPIADLVVNDIKARKKQGIATYGIPLQANNGRCGLQDLYEELLDAACYIKQVLEEKRIYAKAKIR